MFFLESHQFPRCDDHSFTLQSLDHERIMVHRNEALFTINFKLSKATMCYQSPISKASPLESLNS